MSRSKNRSREGVLTLRKICENAPGMLHKNHPRVEEMKYPFLVSLGQTQKNPVSDSFGTTLSLQAGVQVF